MEICFGRSTNSASHFGHDGGHEHGATTPLSNLQRNERAAVNFSCLSPWIQCEDLHLFSFPSSVPNKARRDVMDEKLSNISVRSSWSGSENVEFHCNSQVHFGAGVQVSLECPLNGSQHNQLFPIIQSSEIPIRETEGQSRILRERPFQLYLLVDLETVVSCNRPLNPATNPPQCVAFGNNPDPNGTRRSCWRLVETAPLVSVAALLCMLAMTPLAPSRCRCWPCKIYGSVPCFALSMYMVACFIYSA